MSSWERQAIAFVVVDPDSSRRFIRNAFKSRLRWWNEENKIPIWYSCVSAQMKSWHLFPFGWQLPTNQTFKAEDCHEGAVTSFTVAGAGPASRPTAASRRKETHTEQAGLCGLSFKFKAKLEAGKSTFLFRVATIWKWCLKTNFSHNWDPRSQDWGVLRPTWFVKHLISFSVVDCFFIRAACCGLWSANCENTTSS